jgi:hypothetical protein
MQVVTKFASKAGTLSSRGTAEVSVIASGILPVNKRVLATSLDRTSHAGGATPDYVTCKLSQILLQKLAHSVTKIPERFQQLPLAFNP